MLNKLQMELYHLHPISVHFPIALLLTGLIFEGIGFFKKNSKEFYTISSPLLWLGTVSIVIAIGLGLLAEEKVPHVPSAWEVLYNHKGLGLLTAGLFLILSSWRFLLGNRWQKFFLFLWMIASIVLIITGFFGGKLVFNFGVGVAFQE